MPRFLLKLHLYFIHFEFVLLLVLLENGFTECSFLFIESMFSKENCTLEDCTWSNPRTILAV